MSGLATPTRAGPAPATRPPGGLAGAPARAARPLVHPLARPVVVTLTSPTVTLHFRVGGPRVPARPPLTLGPQPRPAPHRRTHPPSLIHAFILAPTPAHSPVHPLAHQPTHTHSPAPWLAHSFIRPPPLLTCLTRPLPVHSRTPTAPALRPECIRGLPIWRVGR